MQWFENALVRERIHMAQLLELDNLQGRQPADMHDMYAEGHYGAGKHCVSAEAPFSVFHGAHQELQSFMKCECKNARVCSADVERQFTCFCACLGYIIYCR